MARPTITSGRLRRWLSGKISPADVLRLRRPDYDTLAWAAHRRFVKGRYSESERIYQWMSSLWPLDTRPILGLGVCRQAQRAFADAEGYYTRVLAAEPENLHALANRAEVRLIQKRRRDANADLLIALALIQRKPTRVDLDERIRALLHRFDAGDAEVHANDDDSDAIPLDEG